MGTRLQVSAAGTRTVRQAGHHHVFHHSHAPQCARDLKCTTQAGARDIVGRVAVNAPPIEVDLCPLLGLSIPLIRLVSVVFTSAIRPNHTDQLRLGHPEGHMIDRLQSPEALGYLIQLEVDFTSSSASNRAACSSSLSRLETVSFMAMSRPLNQVMMG